MAEKFLTLAQMAERLNRSERQFRNDVAEYDIPHIKLGRAMRFDSAKVELYLESITESKKPIPITSRRAAKPVNKYAEALGL